MHTPPKYLTDHARQPTESGALEILKGGSWCGHGEPDFALFEIHSEHDSSLSLQLPSGDYPALFGVQAFKPGKAPFWIYDPREHPASVYAGSHRSHEHSPMPPHRCKCGSELFKIVVGFEIPGDSDSSEDTSWFALAVECASCRQSEFLLDDETA